MIRIISSRQIPRGIECETTWIGHSCTDHRLAECRSRSPSLDSIVAGIHDVHIVVLVECYRCWRTELIRPRTSDARLTGDRRCIERIFNRQPSIQDQLLLEKKPTRWKLLHTMVATIDNKHRPIRADVDAPRRIQLKIRCPSDTSARHLSIESEIRRDERRNCELTRTPVRLLPLVQRVTRWLPNSDT